MTTSHKSCRNYQRGITIIEILVAVLVLSIGLIGLASLQYTGLRFNQGAYYRSQAVILAKDMENRIRANPAGNYNITTTAQNSSGMSGSYPACVDTANNKQTMNSTSCTPDDVALFDRVDWCQNFADCPLGTPRNILPSSSASLQRDGVTNAIVITVNWIEPADSTTKSVSVRFLI